MTSWCRDETLALPPERWRRVGQSGEPERNLEEYPVTDEHIKGTISKAEGKVEEGLGKLTGNREKQVHGKARQGQGDAQKGLGDVQDAVRKPKRKA